MFKFICTNMWNSCFQLSGWTSLSYETTCTRKWVSVYVSLQIALMPDYKLKCLQQNPLFQTVHWCLFRYTHFKWSSSIRLVLATNWATPSKLVHLDRCLHFNVLSILKLQTFFFKNQHVFKYRIYTIFSPFFSLFYFSLTLELLMFTCHEEIRSNNETLFQVMLLLWNFCDIRNIFITSISTHHM